jgi:hypothetical protein
VPKQAPGQDFTTFPFDSMNCIRFRGYHLSSGQKLESYIRNTPKALSKYRRSNWDIKGKCLKMACSNDYWLDERELRQEKSFIEMIKVRF